MENQEFNISNFQVAIYGAFEKYNDVLSKARCRIFYKYGNRNGGYITDEFAEKLLSTLPYTPVKGIYEIDDYTDHGKKRTEGRIYGIVPENPNVSWEKHVDEDGKERNYVCCDVLIFTTLYPEATEIVGKSQSMELYDKSIKGEWKIIEGARRFVYTDACFLGLQVLGDDVEPCFEGAAFFSLVDKLDKILDRLQEFIKEDGGETMPELLNFKLSHETIHGAIWKLLNPNYTEEGEWAINYGICDVYDEYAVAYNYEEECYERVYYTKEEDTLAISKKVKCFIVDVTESEKATLEAVQALNGGNFENLDTNFVRAEDANATLEAEKNAAKEASDNFELKIEELNNSIATLNTEKENLTSDMEQVSTAFAALKEEKESLEAFKLEVEKKEKEGVIAEYAELVSKDVLDTYAANLENYTAVELDKELAFELKKTGLFTKGESMSGLIPKDEHISGIEAILSKYKK